MREPAPAGAPVLSSLHAQLDPAHTALLVIDIQNDFCAPGGFLQRERQFDFSAYVPMVDRIEHLAGIVRRLGMPVIWLRSIYDFRYLAPSHIAKRGIEGCCLEGSWGAEFFRIRPDPADPVVDKHTFNGFHETSLDALLQARGIRTLLFTGVATNVCVESTLRDAFFRGYHVVLVEDAVGSGNPVGHAGTLSTVRVNFGSVLACADLVHILESRSEERRPPKPA